MPRVSSHFALKDGRFGSLTFPLIVPVTYNTAGAVTLTTDQVLGGLLLRDGNGGARTDTLPDAGPLVEAIQGCMVGTSFQFHLRNTSGTAIAITLAAGNGGTTSGTMTVAQSNGKSFMVVFTNVGVGTEAYTVYSMGTVTF